MIKFSSFSYMVFTTKTLLLLGYYLKVYFNAKFLLKQSLKHFLIEKNQLIYKLHNRNVTLKKQGCINILTRVGEYINVFIFELLFFPKNKNM